MTEPRRGARIRETHGNQNMPKLMRTPLAEVQLSCKLASDWMKVIGKHGPRLGDKFHGNLGILLSHKKTSSMRT